MNAKRTGFALLVLAAVAFGLYQAGGQADQQRLLEAEGFRVDLRIEHSPLLLFDEQRRQGALLFSDRYERFTIDQLTAIEWIEMGGSSQEPRPELRLTLRGTSVEQLRLQGDAHQLRAWQQRLRTLQAAP